MVDFPALPDPGTGLWTSTTPVIGGANALSTLDGDTSKWPVIFDGTSHTLNMHFDGPYPTNYTSVEWVMVARTNGEDVTGTQLLDYNGLVAEFPLVTGTEYVEYAVGIASPGPVLEMLALQESYPDYYFYTLRTMTPQGDLHVTYFALRFHIPATVDLAGAGSLAAYRRGLALARPGTRARFKGARR